MTTINSETTLAELEHAYGPPFIASPCGAVRFNQGFLIAKFMTDHHVLYEERTASFHLYHPATGVWRRAADALIQQHLAADLRALLRHMDQAEDDGRIPRAMLAITQNFLANLCASLKCAAWIDCAFRKRQNFVHAQNVVLDLNELPPTTKTFAPELYSRNALPVPFVPGAECPRFLNELLRPALDEDDIALLRRWCGMALLNRNTAQVILLLTGPAGGGKGTLANIITSIIGEQNVHQLRLSHLDSTLETSLALDASLLSGADVPPDFLNTTTAAHLKSLTGNDLLISDSGRLTKAHPLRGDFNVLLTSSSRLSLDLQDDSAAWARRLLLVEFNRPVTSRRIPDFAALLLRDEGPGILNWMLQGAAEMMEVFRSHEPFPLTPAQRARVENLLSESDSVRRFICTSVQRSTDPAAHITSQDLFAAYLAFCDDRSWAPRTQRTFEFRSRDLMHQIHRAIPVKNIYRTPYSSGQRGYASVILTAQSEALRHSEAVSLSEPPQNNPVGLSSLWQD